MWFSPPRVRFRAVEVRIYVIKPHRGGLNLATCLFSSLLNGCLCAVKILRSESFSSFLEMYDAVISHYIMHYNHFEAP